MAFNHFLDIEDYVQPAALRLMHNGSLAKRSPS
jgi:hypothetical protein